MGQGISKVTKRELIQAITERYRYATKSEKGRILDEFVKLTKYHRKHAIRLLNQDRPVEERSIRPSRRIYDEAVLQALLAIWEAADRICGKRLNIADIIHRKSIEEFYIFSHAGPLVQHWRHFSPTNSICYIPPISYLPVLPFK